MAIKKERVFAFCRIKNTVYMEWRNIMVEWLYNPKFHKNSLRSHRRRQFASIKSKRKEFNVTDFLIPR